MNRVQFTQEGFEKVKKEHEELTKNKREKAVIRLQTARNMGDLSENSEYAAAKEDLAFVEGRIRELEELIKNAEIIQSNHTNGGADIGDKITVEVNGNKDEYQLVGEFEANPLEKKLSTTSPIGKAIFGKNSGEKVEVQVPAGKVIYTIVEIKHP